MGEAERERGRVRLERRVGPVSLVFHLEQVAVEGELHIEAAGHRDREPPVRRKERVQLAVADPLRADQQG